MVLDTTILTWPHAQEEVRFLPLTFYTAAHMPLGISVANTPIAVNDATADVALFLMLGALRRITPSFQAVRQGMRLFPFAYEDFMLNNRQMAGGSGFSARARPKEQSTRDPWHGRDRASGGNASESFRHENPVS